MTAISACKKITIYNELLLCCCCQKLFDNGINILTVQEYKKDPKNVVCIGCNEKL
jgi:hypothetical protein